MKKFLLAAVVGLSFVSCSPGPKPLYYWYNYEDVAYKYSKYQTEEWQNALEQQFNAVLNNQHGSRQTVPPGVCAEYGYYLVKKGETEKGLSFLKKEVELYPESKVYISRIIKQLEK